MDDPLLGNGPLAVDIDPQARLAAVRARLPGPAGTAALDLGGGMELDVDVADPARLAGLTVELPLTGDPGLLPRAVGRRLDVLLGAGRTAQVAAAVRAVAHTDGGDAPLPLAGHGSAGVALSLQRGALAHAAACEAGAPRPVRAVGLLEAAVALDPVADHGLLDLRAAAHRDAHVGAELLVALAARGPLALPDRRTAAALVSLLGEVRQLVERGSAVAQDLAEMITAIERGDHTGHAGATEAEGRADSTTSVDGPSASEARGAVGGPAGLRSGAAASQAPPAEPSRLVPLARRTPVDVDALPGPLTELAIAARRTAPSEIEVRLDGWADRRHGLWARAFDADDDTLVGIAPFVREPSSLLDAVARVLVPHDATGLAGRRVEIDVTDRPEMPRPSPTLALVDRARYQGTRAARAERLGDSAQARYRWSTCARLWGAAGDLERASDARSRAAGHGPSVGPLVSDLVYGC